MEHAEGAFDSRLASSYLDSVLAGDEISAARAVDTARNQGAPVGEIYLGLFVQTQRELGRLWSAGEVSIASEHLATEITARLMDRLREEAHRKPSLGKKAVVSAAPGERHSMGARIVSDFLYLDGWDIDFLGADLPAAELADFARKTHPDLVAISVVLSEDLSSLRDAVAQVKAAVPDAKVLVGGPAILDADEAMKLGAHGFATDAIGAAEMARALVGAPTGITLDQLLASLGEKVQIQRKSRAWKQQQLADLAGLDRTYVSAVENGKQNITISALHKLASAFEMPACWLLPED